MANCPFCEIVLGWTRAADLLDHGEVVSFIPLNPVVPGHRLFVPKRHVGGAASDPALFGKTATEAAIYAKRKLGAANLIASIGQEATQTVFHLHVHAVPRREGDGLALPWTVPHPDEGGRE